MTFREALSCARKLAREHFTGDLRIVFDWDLAPPWNPVKGENKTSDAWAARLFVAGVVVLEARGYNGSVAIEGLVAQLRALRPSVTEPALDTERGVKIMKAKCEAVVTSGDGTHREARFYVDGVQVHTAVMAPHDPNWDLYKEGKEYDVPDPEPDAEGPSITRTPPKEEEAPTDHG